jgi:hypothetical protein
MTVIETRAMNARKAVYSASAFCLTVDAIFVFQVVAIVAFRQPLLRTRELRRHHIGKYS